MNKDNVRTVYKVVRIIKSRYYSAVHYHRQGLSLVYRIGKIRRPVINFSRLFAFEDLEMAQAFANLCKHDLPPCAILECQAAVDNTYSKCALRYPDRVSATEWWMGRLNGAVVIPVPPGTVRCYWIKPIKLIQGE